VKVDIDPAWRGRVFEAAIGSALHRSGAKLSYWRDGKSEVDYVLEFENRLVAVEVKSNSVKNERGLLEFKKNFPNAETILISEEFGEKLLEADNAAKFILALL
jgi:predicted AAA+ superfamily ATPase